MIPIDKGIPIPVNPYPHERPNIVLRIYPWKEMEVGDSFLFPPNIRGVYGATSNASHRYHMRFYSTKTHEGWRCWRVG